MAKPDKTACLLLATASVLCGVAVFVCVRIELFNSAMGGYMPRQPDADFGVSTWRAISPESLRAQMERNFLALNESNGQQGELSDGQKAEIEKTVAHQRVNGPFRDFVGSWGVLQYLIAPLAFLVAVFLVQRKATPRWARAVAIVPVVASGVCIAMLLYRNYWGALGW